MRITTVKNIRTENVSEAAQMAVWHTQKSI